MDGLDQVPYHLVYRIWEYMYENFQPMSLHSYKLVTKYLTREYREHYRSKTMPFRLYKAFYPILPPAASFDIYLKPLISNSFEFIVHLALIGPHLPFSTDDLLSLTQLKNLGVLEVVREIDEFGPQAQSIGTPNFPRVTDDVIRQWSKQPDPFPVLRVLRLWGNDFTTPLSMRDVCKFPALAIYDVARNCTAWDHCGREYFGFTRHPKQGICRDFVRSMNACFKLLVPGFPDDPQPSNGGSAAIISRSYILAFDMPYGLVKIQDGDSVRNIDVPLRVSAVYCNTKVPGLTSYYTTRGYQLYSYIGRLWRDADLIANGLDDATDPLVLDNKKDNTTLSPTRYDSWLENNYAIPPRPYVSVFISENCEYLNPPFIRQYLFVRREYDPERHKEQSTPGGGRKVVLSHRGAPHFQQPEVGPAPRSPKRKREPTEDT
ncbi:hypothetical protein F5Y04DRAFT_255774 [Hypomontagnella monticulosa]|nr:hypothetical protein F5Y04DRAFT_255774 [Hypomontagnella monticulosa]